MKTTSSGSPGEQAAAARARRAAAARARRGRVRVGNGVDGGVGVGGNVLCPIFGLVGCIEQQDYYAGDGAHADKAIKEDLIGKIAIICFRR